MNEANPIFEKLYQLVISSTINVTAIRDREEFFLKHIKDSVTLFELQSFPSVRTVVDIGAGGGFPALPVAITHPEWEITAVESISKKCRFMDACVKELKIQNVKVANVRAEKMRGCFDMILARGTAKTLKLLQFTKHLKSSKGFWVLYKGEKASAELEEAGKFMRTEGLNFEITRIETPFTRSYVRIF